MSEPLTTRATIVNPQGLHARPAQLIVQMANQYQSNLRIRHQEVEANGKSIIEVMTLAAPQGSILEISVQGPDAGQLMQALKDLIARGFGE